MTATPTRQCTRCGGPPPIHAYPAGPVCTACWQDVTGRPYHDAGPINPVGGCGPYFATLIMLAGRLGGVQPRLLG